MRSLVTKLLLLTTASILGCAGYTNLLSGAPLTQQEELASVALLIKNVTIIDPRTGTKTADQSIMISDGLIESVSPASALPHHATYKTINADGLFAVPGFNNMHSHVLQAENPSSVLLLMLAEGVTGFRQMAGSTDLLALREAGQLPLSEKLPALLAMPAEPLIPTSARTVDELAPLLRRQLDDGADFIKVGWMSPKMFYAAITESRKLGVPIAGHIPEGVDPARKELADFRSIEHLGPGDVVWIACSTQKSSLLRESIDHPTRSLPDFRLPNFAAPLIKAAMAGKMKKFLINPLVNDSPSRVSRLNRALISFDRNKCNDLAQKFAKNENWVVPTLVRLRTQHLQNDPEYRRDPAIPYIPPHKYQEWLDVLRDFDRLPPQQKKIYKDAYDSQKKLTKLLADARVPMMTGTDGNGEAPGLSLQQEFKELAASGLSPLQILQMTTIQPARFLKQTSTMGLIENGMNADIVLLSADPTISIDNFSRISAVVRAGNYYSRADLDTYKKNIAEKYQNNL